MQIKESYLRQVIREELLKEKKYAKIDEIAVSLPVAGAAAVGVVGGIALLKKAFRNRSIRRITFDFIKKSKEMFGTNIAGSSFSYLIDVISLKDIADWVKQDKRLSSKTFKGPRANVYSSVMLGEDTLSAFNPSSARKIFIDDESFQFSKEDIRYLNKIYRVIHNREDYNNGGNRKFQLIDTLFYVMITLYNYKYSNEASDSRLDAERELSRILGRKVTFIGKNSWEDENEYKRSLKIMSWRGPHRKLIRIPEDIAKALSPEQITQIADVHVKHADNLTTRLYIPYNINTISIADIESDIRVLKHKFEFLRKVVGVCFTFLAPGASKTIPLFLKALSKAVAGDQGMEIVIDKLIERIENSSLREGKLKEVIKLIISVALNAAV